MHHRLLATLIAGAVTAPLQAQQVATVVVQPESLPGPQLVARNHEAPLQLRGVRSGSVLQLEVVARDPQACLRGVNASLPGGPALAVEPNTGPWLPGLGIAAMSSGRSGTSATPANLPAQNQPPQANAAAAQQPSSSRRVNLGLGLALGAALFERLRDRCEPGVQLRIALPSEADVERMLVEVQLAQRAAPAAAPPTLFSFGLRAADGMLLGSAPPARAAPP
jgi:hypothetical protein